MTIIIFLGVLIISMLLGIPVAFSLLICGLALMWHLDMMDAQILAQNVLEGANNYPMLAVPLFLLAGEIMNAGGLSKRIINFALCLVGHVRGGLGYVSIMSALILAALSGSAIADAAALTAMLLPMMIAAGYNKNRSAGLLASASIIAPIIPPSIAFIIFGVATGTSISKLFMAGIAPGIMMASALWFTWWFLAKKEQVQVMPKSSKEDLIKSFREALLAFGMPIIVVVGLKFGVFTPTEAASVAAVYSLLVSTLVYRELKFSQLYRLFLSAAQTTALVMFLVAASMVSAWMITVANLPSELISILKPFLEHPTLLLISIMIIVVLVSTAMDMTPVILILTPVFMPLIKAAGIDPVYFGVLFIINTSIGLITPPVGVVLSTVAGVGRLNIDEVMRGVLPFILSQLIVLFLLVLFPSLVLVPASWFY